jgi:predicted nucleotidyltransferase
VAFRRAVSDDEVVTGIDDRGDGARLDERGRTRLAAALDGDGVVAALMFGSQSGGMVTPLSDVDVGVWLDPTLDAGARLEARLRLLRAAEQAVGGRGGVDLVVLNDASPLLRHRARESGTLLVERDPVARIRLETRALVEYLDTKPLREELAAGTRSRLSEGRFGR